MTTNQNLGAIINPAAKGSEQKDTPMREGPLKELLSKRDEKTREELISQLDIMRVITV